MVSTWCAEGMRRPRTRPRTACTSRVRPPWHGRNGQRGGVGVTGGRIRVGDSERGRAPYPATRPAVVRLAHGDIASRWEAVSERVSSPPNWRPYGLRKPAPGVGAARSTPFRPSTIGIQCESGTLARRVRRCRQSRNWIVGPGIPAHVPDLEGSSIDGRSSAPSAARRTSPWWVRSRGRVKIGPLGNAQLRGPSPWAWGVVGWLGLGRIPRGRDTCASKLALQPERVEGWAAWPAPWALPLRDRSARRTSSTGTTANG
jgi:hypothetical protein